MSLHSDDEGGYSVRKANGRSILFAVMIAIVLLLSKKANASRPYPWIHDSGAKIELHIGERVIASVPKEKVDIVLSCLNKLEKIFGQQRKSYDYYIKKCDNGTFVISYRNQEDILTITPDLAKFHKSTPMILAGLWLTNIYEAHYGTWDVDKEGAPDDVIATWYGGPRWNGNRMANGETFYDWQLTAACNDVPLNSMVRLSNPGNKKSVIVKVTDRCGKDGMVDMSKLAADLLDVTRRGISKVKMEILYAPSH